MIRSTFKTRIFLMSATILSAFFGQAYGGQVPKYITSWTASPQSVWCSDFIFPTNIPEEMNNQTIRQFVRLSLGGSRVRLVLSNQFGTTATNIGRVAVGVVSKQSPDSHIKLSNIKNVTFDHIRHTQILPGSSILSDPIELEVESLDDLAISIYLPDKTTVNTFHWDARQTSWIEEGERSLTQSIENSGLATSARLILSAVQVENNKSIGVIAVMGDSITDGATASMDKNTRWPDFLAKRLVPHNIAVINAGISGARLLSDGMGQNALARLNNDVLMQPGVSSLILMLGINDIAWPGTVFALDEKRPTLEQFKAGYSQIVAQAHNAGVKVIGTTITPFKDALPDTPLDNYYSDDKDILRQKVNTWIRTTDTFDYVIDFAAILQNSDDPSRLAAQFDSSDHLHPSDAGNKAMADAIKLEELIASAISKSGEE